MSLAPARNMSIAALLALIAVAPASAAQFRTYPGTFEEHQSNNVPLVFGMSKIDAATALGSKLAYISGKPGDEILLAIRRNGGSGLFPRADRLFLQFRRDRLTGWKGDWGTHWPWWR